MSPADSYVWLPDFFHLQSLAYFFLLSIYFCYTVTEKDAVVWPARAILSFQAPTLITVFNLLPKVILKK